MPKEARPETRDVGDALTETYDADISATLFFKVRGPAIEQASTK